jgi:hypothetical protein
MNTPRTFGQWVVFIIVAMGLIAIVLAAAHYFGFVIPQIAYTVAGIVIVVVLLVLAAKFLLGVGGKE